jgi:hypothetical protein
VKREITLYTLGLSLVLPSAVSQTVASAPTSPPIAAASAPTPVPPLVPYAGVAFDAQGKPLANSASISFLIFKDETGGEPLFVETQTVAFDPTGHYKVQLGATLPNGLPTDLFSTGEARWLEVQIAGEAPQPRVLLVSVPYALKAGDAATIGGLPASAFALAGSGASTRNTAAPNLTSDIIADVTTTGGMAGFIPEFNGTATIVDSPLFIRGANVGISTTTPTATLDVNGTALLIGLLTANGGASIGGALTLPATATATAAGGFDSQLLKLYTSGYNSSTHAVVDPRFEWQAVHAGNGTASPSATLNLLSSATSAAATQTGFSFNINGTMNFAHGQTFPGTGTITGVTAGMDLTGGGTSGNVTLNLDTTKILTGVTAGTGLLGGGTSGNITLGLNPSIVPLLASNNSFTGNQAVAGDLSVSGAASAGTVNAANAFGLGGSLFATGSPSTGSVFLGFSSNTSSSGGDNTGLGVGALMYNDTGNDNTASGNAALWVNTTGSYNTASGSYALFANTGSDNTATGYDALSNNTTGNKNTAIGYSAGPDPASNSLMNSTAIGANAAVSQSNTLVLGQATAGSPGASYVNAGIGTATPRSILEAVVQASSALGPVLTLTNTGGNLDARSALDFNTYAPSTIGTYNPAARIEAIDAGGNSDFVAFEANQQGAPNRGLLTTMFIDPSGNVNVTGTFSAASKYFRIDHPLDPTNKYLVHSSVESSEMMNIYSGNVTTDELGLATVKLPNWFEAENADFRYQLTVLDERFAQAVVSKKIQNSQFTIHTNASHVEVSWQITAVRQDTYAKAHPLIVEQEKPETERGSTWDKPRLSHEQPASAVDKKFPVPQPQAMPTFKPRIHPVAATKEVTEAK